MTDKPAIYVNGTLEPHSYGMRLVLRYKYRRYIPTWLLRNKRFCRFLRRFTALWIAVEDRGVVTLDKPAPTDSKIAVLYPVKWD